MRRLILILALLGASLGGVMGAGAATASAANCTASTGAVYWNSGLQWDVLVSGCTGVDKVQFYDSNTAGWNGLWDGNENYFHSSNSCIGCSPGVYTVVNGQVPLVSYRVQPWCPVPQTTHAVAPYWTFRIHNSTYPGSWGGWNQKHGANQNIWC